MVNNGYITGVSDSSLGLSSNTTRAEFITMLVRTLGLEQSDYKPVFDDVSPDDWYASYMVTAQKNGLIEGSGGKAYLEQVITREEMAKILVNAYEIQTGKTPDAAEIGYEDAGQISSWAGEYVAQAVSLGLMNGISETVFAPQESAKREQAIVVVYRLLNLE